MPAPQEPELPDLRGQRALITGASDGIGLQIAARLATAGAELVLPVRNPDKGRAAADRIQRTTPSATIDLPMLDLASLESVSALGDELLRDGRPIQLLVNNAGVMQPPSRQTTRDGFEMQFGTNHLGHVALVARLLPLLRAGGARVVSQTSVAARSGSINWDDPNWERRYDSAKAYAQSKIAIGLFGAELQRRSTAAGWGITSAVAHPGVAPTSLLAARPEIGRATDTLVVRVIRMLSRRGVLIGTPESAALPAVLAATAALPGPGEMHGPTGPGRVGGAPGLQSLYPPLRDPASASRLWELSEQLVGVRFEG